MSALSAAYGLPVALSAGGAVAGLLTGLAILGFIYAKSRGLAKV